MKREREKIYGCLRSLSLCCRNFFIAGDSVTVPRGLSRIHACGLRGIYIIVLRLIVLCTYRDL